MVLQWTASCEVLPPQPGSLWLEPSSSLDRDCLWFQSLKVLPTVQIARVSKMWNACIPSETLADIAGSSLRPRVHRGGTSQLRCQPRPPSLDWRPASMSWKQPLDWCTRCGDTRHGMYEGRDSYADAFNWVLSSYLHIVPSSVSVILPTLGSLVSAGAMTMWAPCISL